MLQRQRRRTPKGRTYYVYVLELERDGPSVYLDETKDYDACRAIGERVVKTLHLSMRDESERGAGGDPRGGQARRDGAGAGHPAGGGPHGPRSAGQQSRHAKGHLVKT
ncbi:MAG TPA: hypothetical protein VFH51_12145 [Myxococcota bacterium]|nr:hypothetical protein [Myxococcota bacterium]